MKLAVLTNVYGTPYYEDWKRGIAKQLDMDFDIYFNPVYATDNADCVLCLDIDDIPEPALVHIAKINARKYDVTALAMKLVNEDNEMYGLFGRVVDINKYNVWGLGNTVWKSGVLRELLPIKYDAPFPDWDLAKRASDMGCSMHFERIPLIRYRRYNEAKQAGLVKLGDVYVWGKHTNFESEPE